MLYDYAGPKVTGMIGLVSACVALAGVLCALLFKKVEFLVRLFWFGFESAL
jgi:hypothetical protein